MVSPVDEIRVETHSHEQVSGMRFMPVKLNERVKNFTINEALLFQCL